MPRIEQTALSNLIHNEEYTRKVLPFIKEEYFADKLEVYYSLRYIVLLISIIIYQQKNLYLLK